MFLSTSRWTYPRPPPRSGEHTLGASTRRPSGPNLPENSRCVRRVLRSCRRRSVLVESNTVKRQYRRVLVVLVLARTLILLLLLLLSGRHKRDFPLL